jgi:hypothetical protein
MDVRAKKPPRRFEVGHEGNRITLSHCADIMLMPDEQVTFVTASGTQYDVVRKSWGYYATPSLNARLPSHGLRPALVSSGSRRYLLLVEADKLDALHAYLLSQGMKLVAWLDVEDVAPLARHKESP